MQIRTIVVESQARASMIAAGSADLLRSHASCTASSASADEPSIRYAIPRSKVRCRSNSSSSIGLLPGGSGCICRHRRGSPSKCDTCSGAVTRRPPTSSSWQDPFRPMKTKGIASRFLKISLACLASPSCQPYRLCDPVDDAAVGELPERLSATGLFAGQEAESLAPDVRSFRPRFELWSDGASKRRWIWLPPGTRIDSSEMDAWQFPVGTKLWKEFTRDAVRVETRLLERRPSGWIGLAYLWQNEGRDATAAPFGAIDPLGTSHNVPA